MVKLGVYFVNEAHIRFICLELALHVCMYMYHFAHCTRGQSESAIRTLPVTSFVEHTNNLSHQNQKRVTRCGLFRCKHWLLEVFEEDVMERKPAAGEFFYRHS